MEASRRESNSSAFRAHFGRISRHFTGALLPHFTGAKRRPNRQRRRPTSGSINFAKKSILIHSLLPAFGLSFCLTLSLSDSVLLTLSLLYAHTIMITIFPSLQLLLCVCVCVECSQQQQQQITFINWFLARKSVCVCVCVTKLCCSILGAGSEGESKRGS